MKQKRKTIFLLGILLLLVIGISYAAWRFFTYQEENNRVTSSCLKYFFNGCNRWNSFRKCLSN